MTGWDELVRGGVPPPCRASGDVRSADPAVDAEEPYPVCLLAEHLLAGRCQPERLRTINPYFTTEIKGHTPGLYRHPR